SHDLLARIEKAQRRPQSDLVDRLDAALGAGGELRRLAAPFTDEEAGRTRVVMLEPEAAVPTLRLLIAQVRAADHTMAAAHLEELLAYTAAGQRVAAQLGAAQRKSLY